MIAVNEPLLGERELEYVTECLRTGWISSAGRFIEEFEEKWAAYCGMKYGIAVCNKKADLVTKLNQGIAAVKADGTLDKLIQKWIVAAQ